MTALWTILGALAVAWLLKPRREQPMQTIDKHIVALIKENGDMYTYTFTAAYRRDTLRVIGRQAVHPDLSLDWRDALVLEEKICAVTRNRKPR